MNRKARRAAQHQEQKLRTVQMAPTSGQQLFDVALHHQQNGRLAEAAQLYHHILATNPRHFESLQNLGVIALGAKRDEMAADFFKRALAVNESSVDVHSSIAMALNKLGRYGEAAAHSRRAIALNPNYPWPHMTLASALWVQGQLNDAVASYQCVLLLKPNLAEANAYLGKLLIELNRFEEARQCLDRAIALNPESPQGHLWLGDLHVARGDNAGSLEHFVRAMELNPDDTVAHYSFGAALMMMGNFRAVMEYYEKFLQIQPEFVHGYNLLGRAYSQAGYPEAAVDAVRRGLAMKETPQGKSLLAECLSNLETCGPDLREMLIRAVSEPWLRPRMLARHCISLVLKNQEIAACISRAEAAWPGRTAADEFFGSAGLEAMGRDRLLLVYLENSRVIGLQIEKFITALRFALLDKAISMPADTDEYALALCCAVARQCFVSEYAFIHTGDEFAKVARLRDSLLATVNTDAPVSAFQVAVLAAYIPLNSLPGLEKLSTQSWSQPFEALLTQQIREPTKEYQLRTTIPAITPINDAISTAVRDQYEHNPYPRWVAAHSAGIQISINEYIRSQFPMADFRRLAPEVPLQVLAAGCGTGQALVDGYRFAGAQTLAVDLSLSSLSYAKRKLQEMNLPDVELAQADILELGSLNRTFDFINSAGVLHHLRDPIAGLRVLLSLLKPDGFMQLALYSELGRVNYVAAQKLIVERGYGSSSDEIRRFRRDLIASAETPMRTGVLACPDFYSISECRDLLFHVQEHRMTIPQLKAIFEAHNLRFIGFNVEPRIRTAYTQRFPEDARLDNLDNWHVFEQENPRTFVGMYSFWVQNGCAAA